MDSISTANCKVSDICLYIGSLMKSVVEEKRYRMYGCWHFPFVLLWRRRFWDTHLLSANKQLRNVGTLGSALEEGGLEPFRPSAVLSLACSPAPSPFSAHGLWTISATQILHIQSQFLHCLYAAALKAELFAFGLICFLLQTVMVFLGFYARPC